MSVQDETGVRRDAADATERAPAHRGLRGHPWLALASVAMGVIMVGLDGSVVAIANPYIGRSLGASLADLQWVTNAYLLVLAVLLVVGGKLGDRYGRRLMFLVGVAGFALASVAVGLAGSTGGVIAARAVQGAFGALLMPNSLALLRSAFPPAMFNTAVGIWGGSSALATAGGPIVAGLLVEHVSWQSVFYINAPVGVFALALGATVLRESRESEHHRLDAPGLLTLAGGLFLLVFGLIKAQTWGWASGPTLGMFAGAVVLLVAFVVTESRVRHPLVPLHIFRDRSVSLGTITVIMTFFSLFGVLFFVGLYLQSVHGYSAVQAGVRTLPLTAVFALSSPLGAVLTKRFGPRVPITLGLLSVAGALFALTTLGAHSSYVHLWPPFLFLGVGIGMVIVASTEAIVGNVPVDEAGIAGGIQSTAVQLGGVLGTAVLGSVVANQVGRLLVDKLVHAGVPAALAPRFEPAKELVAQGLAPVVPQMPPALARAVTEGSHAAFMSGLHTAMVVAAIVALVGAAVAPLIRRGATEGATPVAV